VVLQKDDEKYFCGRVFETGHNVRDNGRVISDHAAMRRYDERSFCGNLIRKDTGTGFSYGEVCVGHLNNISGDE
jgi:hypothetical protein